MPNPWLSLWLSAANSWASAMRSFGTAELHRQQTATANEMVRQLTDFWVMALKLLDPGRFETLSIAAYLSLGWTILVAIDHLITAVSLRALVLLVAGGILYSASVLFYCWHRLPYQRAIWHGFVLAAAACQYFAILDVLASRG